MANIAAERQEIFGVTVCPQHQMENLLKCSDPVRVISYTIADFGYCPVPECGRVAFIMPERARGLETAVIRQAVQIAALGKKIAAAERNR